MKILNKIIYFIKNGNECSKCKCFKEIKTSYEYNEYDCFCYIKKNYDKKCYIINPLKSILYFFKKRKYDYYEAHQYDHIGEWYEESQRREQKFIDIVKNALGEDKICYSSSNEYYPYGEEYIRELCYKIKCEYDDYFISSKKPSLKIQWKNLIKETLRYINIKIK